MDDFTRTQTISKIFRCGHLIHSNCLESWVARNLEKPKCPCCNQNMIEGQQDDWLKLAIYHSLDFFCYNNSVNFILKALEYQIPLHLFVLFHTLLLLEFVVLHGAAHILGGVFGMEHMRAQIQHGLPLTDRSFTAWVRGCHILWAGVLKIEPLDKVRNPVNEVCLLKSCAEALLWQVAQTDEQVDQNWGRDRGL